MTISGGQPSSASGMSPMGHQPANLGDILERVLDRGLVIVGDIRISLLDIELLTVKLRLLVASVDTARQLGIDWWEHDPWLTSASRPQPRAPLTADARRREQVTMEQGSGEPPPLELTPEPIREDREVQD